MEGPNSRDDSDDLLILRELAVLCLLSEPAPDVAPNKKSRVSSMHSSMPAAKAGMLSPFHSPTGANIKQNLVTMSLLE